LLKGVLDVRAEENASFEKNRAAYDGAGANQATPDEGRHDKAISSTRSPEAAEHLLAERGAYQRLNTQLREKATTLGLAEVFGLARQVANDTATVLQQSLISTQYPPKAGEQWRDDFLREFSASRITPKAAELERLWIEIQREMTASGQVAKYQTKVVQPNGDEVNAQVVRIGPFTAMADGQFLSYLPSLRYLNVLPRQLPSQFMSVANRFKSASGGYAQAVVDQRAACSWHACRAADVDGARSARPGNRLRDHSRRRTRRARVSSTSSSASRSSAWPWPAAQAARSADAEHPLGRVLLAFKGDKSAIEEDSRTTADAWKLSSPSGVFASARDRALAGVPVAVVGTSESSSMALLSPLNASSTRPSGLVRHRPIELLELPAHGHADEREAEELVEERERAECADKNDHVADFLAEPNALHPRRAARHACRGARRAFVDDGLGIATEALLKRFATDMNCDGSCRGNTFR